MLEKSHHDVDGVIARVVVKMATITIITTKQIKPMESSEERMASRVDIINNNLFSMAFHHMLGWSMPCWAGTACRRQGTIVAASAVGLVELEVCLQQRGHPRLKARHHRQLLSMACQTHERQDRMPCQIPITRTEKSNLSTEIIEIATSIHPPRPIPRRPRTHPRLTRLKTLVIPIEIQLLAITPTPVPCQMATVQRDIISLRVEVVVSAACLSEVEGQGRRRMTALLPR